jgi:hypothetical protein
MNDKKLAKWLFLLLLLPLGLAFFSEERFRYPCQDPANWDKDFCQRPLCDVTRTCPDHIFKGQRDPKLGPTNEPNKTTTTSVSGMGTQGANCGK